MSARQQTLISPFVFAAVVILGGVTLMKVAGAKISPPGSDEIPRTTENTTWTPQTSHRAFSLTSERKVSSGGGPERLLSTVQRFQRSDGIFKLVHTFYTPGGTISRVDTSFGFTGIGVFRLDTSLRRLVFTWPQIDDRPENVERFLREHPLFAREESLQGVNTIVWHQAGSVETEFIEEYRAPSLGGLQIKTVKVSRRGRETLEPTELDMRDPAQSLFTELFLYPVDYSSFERYVQEAEGRNAREVAQLMREALVRIRQIRP